MQKGQRGGSISGLATIPTNPKQAAEVNEIDAAGPCLRAKWPARTSDLLSGLSRTIKQPVNCAGH